MITDQTAGDPIIHIAAQPLTIGPFLRQICAWCGYQLLDYDLRNVSVAISSDDDHHAHSPATWPISEPVAVDGSMAYTIEHEDGAELPPNACAVIEKAAQEHLDDL